MARFVIEDWMISKIGLGGHSLLAFALIHSVTNSKDGCWYGGYDKLAERIGSKQRNAVNAVKFLLENGLITKEPVTISGKIHSVLKSAVPSSAKNDICSANFALQKTALPLQKTTSALQKKTRCSAKIADSNIIYNNSV